MPLSDKTSEIIDDITFGHSGFLMLWKHREAVNELRMELARVQCDLDDMERAVKHADARADQSLEAVNTLESQLAVEEEHYEELSAKYDGLKGYVAQLEKDLAAAQRTIAELRADASETGRQRALAASACRALCDIELKVREFREQVG